MKNLKSNGERFVSREGYAFDLRDETWVLSRDIAFKPGFIKKHLNVFVVDRYLRVLAFLATCDAPRTVLNIDQAFRKLAIFSGARVLDSGLLLAFRNEGDSQDFHLASIRTLFRTWANLGYYGVDTHRAERQFARQPGSHSLPGLNFSKKLRKKPAVCCMQHSTFSWQRALSYLLRAGRMTSKSDFGGALREIRLLKQLPQESLGPSQSFISALERGLRSPTMEKFEKLAELLDINPVTLLAYVALRNGQSVDSLLSLVRKELQELERMAQG